MSPRENHTATSTRRRPSLSFRSHPRPTGHPAPISKDCAFDIWQEPCLTEVCQDDHAPVVEEMDPFPNAVPRRRGAKSFSSLKHPVDGLVALGRRLSVSLRHKSSKQNISVAENLHLDDEDRQYHHVPSQPKHKRMASGSWDARSTKVHWHQGYSVNRRPSLNSVSALEGFYAPTASVPAPIPGRGQAPPVVPTHVFSGAAARAAAAAQNEQMEVARMAKAERESSKILEMRVPQDSESGIGIDLRDRSEMSDADLLGLIRLDPVALLPAEISAHILSYLDPDSLLNSELVSRGWFRASSSHVWKHVFRGAYERRPPSETASKLKQSSGLGKSIPNQNWKKMFLVRRALDQRWKDGKAAAIYLQGHTDGVYCSQFDENKIITGSRDRTIRVWDTQYPWKCQKVIGPPSARAFHRGPVNSPISQASGTSPFITITPPWLSPDEAADITVPVEEEDESIYHTASILCLKFDEEIMVTGSSDYTCIVYDIKDDYRPIRRLYGHQAGVLDVCFDDRFIVSCSKDSTICVWDRHTGELLRQLTGHLGPVNAVQLRGDLIVSASGDCVAKMWNVISGQCVKQFLSKDRGLACVEFSDDGRTILTGGNDQIIYHFDANTGELVNELDGHHGLVRSLHLDSANNRIVSGSYDHSVKVFDRDSGNLSINFPGWATSWMLSVQSDYRRIVATSQDSRVVIIDFGYGLDGIELLEE
jgi:F-box and WD-40 domain protein 1/11